MLWLCVMYWRSRTDFRATAFLVGKGGIQSIPHTQVFRVYYRSGLLKVIVFIDNCD